MKAGMVKGGAKLDEKKLLLLRAEPFWHAGLQVLWRGEIAVSWVG